MLHAYMDGDLEFMAVVRDLVPAPKPVTRYCICAGELCEYGIKDSVTGELVLDTDDINLALQVMSELNNRQVA